jgi:hypothetical protein
MPYVKRIICLANSTKSYPDRCIAGREVLPDGTYGGWVRPVSEREDAAVRFSESRYDAGNRQPKLLDIMDVPLLRPDPRHHQSENHVIDSTQLWGKVGALPANSLPQLLDNPPTLWINSDRTSAGAFNCISQEEAITQHYSLALIRPENFVVKVSSKTWDGITKKTTRSSFSYNGVLYILQLTDPVVTDLYHSKEVGEYPLNGVTICVSLTEPWKKDRNRCHKLVAAVFQ